jgi:hypothetical protein
MQSAFYKSDRATYPWWRKYPGVVAMAAVSYYFGRWGLLFLYGPLLGFIAGGIVSGGWWFDNDEDADKSFVYRYIRNIGMNGKRFALGVGDRDHWVTGRSPALTVLRRDIGERGWQWSAIWIGPLPLLPFVSYSGTLIEGYIGWQPWGELSFKLTRADGKGWQLW